MKTTLFAAAFCAVSLPLAIDCSFALAEPAEVSVGSVDEFARPPPRAIDEIDDDAPRVVDADPPPRAAPAPAAAYRSPVRLEVGPVGVTTGRDLGLGLGAGVSFGTGTAGVRLSGAWMRAGASPGEPAQAAPLGSSLGQYTGELTIDLHKRGPLHPLFGLGFGVLHASGPIGRGNAGIGTARAGLEYSLGLEDVDVRLGAWVSGSLPGPASEALASLHAYAVTGAGVAIGF